MGVLGHVRCPVTVGSEHRGAVDGAVDGIGRKPCERREHLGGAAGRCHEFGGDADMVERPHQGTHYGGFARAGVAVEDEHRIHRRIERAEARQSGHQLDLLVGRLERQPFERHHGEAFNVHSSEGKWDRGDGAPLRPVSAPGTVDGVSRAFRIARLWRARGAHGGRLCRRPYRLSASTLRSAG